MDKYSFGTNSDVAPYFHAMMSSFAKVAKQLNSIVRKFKKHLDDADKLLINVDFDKELNDLGKYRDLIPSLSGNEGVVLDKTGAEVKPAASNKVVVLDTSAPKHAAHHALASIENAEVSLQPQATNTPAPTTPAVMPWETQTQQPPQPQYQPQAHQATKESDTVSFSDLLAKRMGVAAQPQPMMMQPQYQQPVQQPMMTPQQMFAQQFAQPQQTMMGFPGQYQQPMQQPFMQQPMFPTGI